MENCVRVINENFQGMGRRFVKADIVCIINDEIYHMYPDNDGLDHIKDKLEDVDKKVMGEIVANSIKI